MKKIVRIILKVLAGLILLILVLLFTVPVIFKKQIKAEVETVINESLNAKVTFADYKLTFFRNFPNLSFSLKGLYVAGVDKFEGDTLAGFKSFDLVFNLGSLIGNSGYEVKSILINEAVVNAIVLKDGSANWDITKPSAPDTVASQAVTAESSSENPMKILLKKFEILKSKINYIDASSAMSANLEDLNFILKGDMTGSTTDLKMDFTVGAFTFTMDGVKYINRAGVLSNIDMFADLDKMKFSFKESYISLNDLKMKLAGTIEMPGDDISTDITFGTEKTSFKTLLSMVPAMYMSDFKDLVATGDFTLAGSAKGIYSDADSTLPDVALNMIVNNGLISYPALPEKITNIAIKSDVFVDGKDLDKTTVSLEKFHMELAGSPFDMTFFAKTPMSDPDFKGTMNGKIDLTALSKAVPMDSINLSGVIEMAISMAGKLSMIEKEQYDKFSASGKLGIANMVVEMAGYPKVEIKDASFQFTPAFAEIVKANIIVAEKSDFSISGQVRNYIPYVFKNETLSGTMAMSSRLVDASGIMASMATDTATIEVDTSSLAVISVPRNIDFRFNALIEKFTYDNIIVEKVKAGIIVRDGILSFRDAGMNILGGTIQLNADYDTRDTLKPSMKADFSMKNIGIKDAFTTFVMIQKLAPAAKGIEGKISVQMAYQSLLGSDMMPVISTIDGAGKLQSDQVTLVESPTFDKLKGVLKLGDKYTNTFKDVNVSFKIKEGRVFVSPFNVKLGNIKMNIGGDQGLDQTLNYLIKTEIPRADLGGSVNTLIDNLSSQASAFGIAFKPADIIKVNVRVKGTFTKPEVAPDFGGGAGSGTGEGSVKETVKETIKQTVDNTVDKGKEKLREEAAIQGDKLIKEANERGQQLRDQAAKAAEKLRQEADSSGAKLTTAAQSKNVLAKAAAQKSADILKKEADKRGNQLILEADNQAKKLVEDAKLKKEEMIKKI